MRHVLSDYRFLITDYQLNLLKFVGNHVNPSVKRLLLFGLLAALAGCDVIDAPVPPTQVLTVSAADTRALDSAATLTALPEPVQRVLLEDYTGHQCGNCPRAARKATELIGQYGDRLVVVGTHVGYYARLTPPHYTYDFRTDAGDKLNEDFGVDVLGLPQGMINRTPPANGTSPAVSDGAWAGRVADALKAPVEQQLTLTPLYDPATRTLRLKMRTKYLVSKPGHTYRLVLDVIEDSVHHWQKDYAITDPTNPQKDDSTYFHRHVLRAAPLSPYGVLDAKNPQTGLLVDAYARYELPAAWDARHCAVVVYLLDATAASSKDWRVTQVAEAEVD